MAIHIRLEGLKIDFPKHIRLHYETDEDLVWYGYRYRDRGIKVQNQLDELFWDIMILYEDDEISNYEIIKRSLLYRSAHNKEVAFDILRRIGFDIDIPLPIKLTQWLGDGHSELSGCKNREIQDRMEAERRKAWLEGEDTDFVNEENAQ